MTTTILFLESADEVELGTEPARIFETTDYGTTHSAEPFTVAVFDCDLDDIELGTEPFMIL